MTAAQSSDRHRPAIRDSGAHLLWPGAGAARGRDRRASPRSGPEGRRGRLRARSRDGRPEERQAAARGLVGLEAAPASAGSARCPWSSSAPRASARPARPHDVRRAAAALRRACLARATAARGCWSGSPTAASCGSASSAPSSGPGRSCSRPATSPARRWSPRSAPRPGRRRRSRSSPRVLDQPRHLHPLLRDQRTIAGIGRSWVDEILWEARLSPFKKGAELERRGGRAHPRRPGGPRRRDRPLRGGRRRDGPRQDADAAAGPPPRGRALPALRRPRSPRSTTPSGSRATARPSRPAARCSPTAASRGC